jgi:hypothetical protein
VCCPQEMARVQVVENSQGRDQLPGASERHHISNQQLVINKLPKHTFLVMGVVTRLSTVLIAVVIGVRPALAHVALRYPPARLQNGASGSYKCLPRTLEIKALSEGAAQASSRWQAHLEARVRSDACSSRSCIHLIGGWSVGDHVSLWLAWGLTVCYVRSFVNA